VFLDTRSSIQNEGGTSRNRVHMTLVTRTGVECQVGSERRIQTCMDEGKGLESDGQRWKQMDTEESVTPEGG
jgi:hypothetical protein